MQATPGLDRVTWACDVRRMVSSAAGCCSLRSQLRSPGGSLAPCVMTQVGAHDPQKQATLTTIDLHHSPALHGALVLGCRLRCRHRCRQLALVDWFCFPAAASPTDRRQRRRHESLTCSRTPLVSAIAERTQCAPLWSGGRSMRQGPPTTPRRGQAGMAIDHLSPYEGSSCGERACETLRTVTGRYNGRASSI